MVTLLLRLEDAVVGGNTVFPMAGVSMRPVKYSAILWMNKYGNLESNEDMKHTGCPVALGRKIIFTRQYDIHDRTHKYKYPTHAKGEYSLKINGK